MKPFFFSILFTFITFNVYASEEGRYDDGARWAFISDANSPNIAVVDTFNFKYQDTIKLKAIPTHLVVSDIQNLLVYIDGIHPTVFIYDLVTKKHSTMPLKKIPNEILFHPDGAQMAIASRDQIELIKPLELEFIDTINDISTPFSMNYDDGGYNLYISESNTGKTLIYRNHDKKRSIIQVGTGNVSDITLSPDSRLALVSQYKDNSVVVWDLSIEAPFGTFHFDSTPYRPYVSSDSEHIIIADEQGRAKVIESWGGETIQEFQLKGSPESIRTGWIETMGIIESSGHLDIFNLTDHSINSINLQHDLKEMVVVSDSKTLFATQTDSSKLFVYDIRANKLRKEIRTGLTQPNLLAMGITNTVCH
ncbi:WD40 repeat domain-containing protein [Vibrio sp. SS-MA-C1-2]|uniref:WD40 repeat domain-containing protein n=1 Tax=Vibrio sp. SS-MA-C1-2 TaxID=2908646 RepID=UPI001F229F4F|nr:WD40 repeat domain-containing protein [Vibrio sp. SS-MA-C1-2]UJF17280.1 WD40 repeat domain-containing protein [Vibrio sp. SS-MA-C1-2]